MPSSQTQVPMVVQHFLRLLRQRGWIVAVCVVVTAAAAFALSKAQTTQYTATAAILFTDNNVAAQASGETAVPSTDPQVEIYTNLALLQSSQAVFEQTASALGHGLTAAQVQGAISPTEQGLPGSEVVSISATWPDAHLAAAIANTFARAFITEQIRTNQGTIQSALDLVRQQYLGMTPTQRLTPQGQSLVDRLESLRVLKSMQNNVQLVHTAAVPTSPSSPKVFRNVALGAILGLLLGLVLAWFVERIDQRLREPEDVEAVFGLPMLGLIPHRANPRSKSGHATVALEAFRMLRARLRYFNVDRELRVLLVTSAQPSEGKTTISLNLAAAAASMGSRTILIEADLRKPTIATNIGGAEGIGLTNLLVDGGSIDDAVSTVAVEQATPGQTYDHGHALGELSILTAGPPAPNPTELLESNAMRQLLASARDTYDLVVIDTPPLSAVADAIPLIEQVDGVVIVSRLGLSRRDATGRLRDLLRSIAAPVLGVVVNDIESTTSYYGYDQKTYGTAREFVLVPRVHAPRSQAVASHVAD